MRPLTDAILNAQRSRSPKARVSVRVNAWSVFGGTPYEWQTLSTSTPPEITSVNGACAVACELPGGQALRVLLPDDGNLYWQKVTTPQTANGWKAAVQTDTTYEMNTGAPALVPSPTGADLIWGAYEDFFRRPYNAASNTWGSRTTIQVNNSADNHLRAIKSGNSIFLLSANNLSEYDSDYTFVGDASIDAYYRDKGFIPAGLRVDDTNVYCYLYNPNYDNPHGSDYYSLLVELKFNRPSPGSLTFVNAGRGFSGMRFIEYTGEGIGDWEYSEDEPRNPKQLTLERATYGPGPNRPLFCFYEEAGNAYSTIAEQDPSGLFLSDSEPYPDWPQLHGVGPRDTPEELHPVQIGANHYLIAAGQVHKAVLHPSPIEDEELVPIAYNYTQSVPGAVSGKANNAEFLFQGKTGIQAGDKLTLKTSVHSTWDNTGGSITKTLIVTDVDETHPDSRIFAADPIAFIGQHKLRRESAYRAPSTPIVEVLHHLFNKSGIRVNNLTRDTTIIESGIHIFPNDNLRSAAYRLNALSKHFYYLPDNDQDDPTIKITRQKYGHEAASYQYGPDHHPLHNSRNKESMIEESISIAAGSWHDTVKAGDPADPYNSRNVTAIERNTTLPGRQPRWLVHTDNTHLFNNVRLKNTAKENAGQLRRKNIDCVIYAGVNLGLEVNDLIEVTDDFLGYNKKKLQVNAITETWNQGRLYHNMALCEPLGQRKVSLAAGEITYQSEGVMWKGQTPPHSINEDNDESSVELVRADNETRRVKDPFHPAYITAGATTYMDFLEFADSGVLHLNLRRDLPPFSGQHRITLTGSTTGTQVSLSWNRFRFQGESSRVDASFQVEYKTPETDWTETGSRVSGSSGNLSFTHTNLEVRTPYTYRVTAYTPTNEKGPTSNELTITPTGEDTPEGVQEITTSAKNNFGLAIFLSSGRTFKWTGDVLFPSDPIHPYSFAETAVAAAGTPNNGRLRKLIAASKYVVAVIVDRSDPHIDWDNLQWCPPSVVEATIAASNLPPKITSLTATPITTSPSP